MKKSPVQEHINNLLSTINVTRYAVTDVKNILRTIVNNTEHELTILKTLGILTDIEKNLTAISNDRSELRILSDYDKPKYFVNANLFINDNWINAAVEITAEETYPSIIEEVIDILMERNNLPSRSHIKINNISKL